jgi:hypothetical protein
VQNRKASALRMMKFAMCARVKHGVLAAPLRGARADVVPPRARALASPRSSISKLRTIAQPASHSFDHTLPTNPSIPSQTDKMGGVTVKDVEAQKFITSYAAFLKRQGKLPM